MTLGPNDAHYLLKTTDIADAFEDINNVVIEKQK